MKLAPLLLTDKRLDRVGEETRLLSPSLSLSLPLSLSGEMGMRIRGERPRMFVFFTRKVTAFSLRLPVHFDCGFLSTSPKTNTLKKSYTFY